MAEKKIKFKWVRIPAMYGIRNWKGYELYISERKNRVALVEKVPKTNGYTALVDFNQQGGSGTYLGYNKKTGKIPVFHYLEDVKRAVEKHYGLKK